MFASAEAYHASMDDPEIVDPIFESTTQAGFEAVTWIDAGTRNFYTVSTPIETPADLKGLKICVQQSPTNVQMMDLLGGSATPMGFGIVIGGIVIGVFTATEGSAIAVVYALILGICYRNITLKSFWKIVVDSAKMSGMVVFLIGVSNILGWVMAFLQIPQAVSAALLGITDSPVLILLIMNVILLIAGTFMDVTPAILIFTPLFLPIVQTFGMHPVHFGLILVYNLCIGNITPPVGNTTLAKTIPYMLWYYLAILVGLLLVTYVPFLSIGLPTAAGLI